MKPPTLLDKIRSAFRQSNTPVYDPSYVYAPWRKWVILAIIILVAGLVWLGVANAKDTGTQDGALMSAGALTESAKDTPQPSGPKKELYSVVKVIDGDTLDVSINGKTERLRLIGVDTPETVDLRKTVQCFGKEASNKAASMLQNAKVHLEQDPSQGERDKYGRLLMYVFLEDGTNFNKIMISEGYAHEYTYELPYKYQTEFKAAQTSATAGDKGLWSPSTCNGDTTSAATPAQASTTQQSSSAAAAPSGNCDENYTPCIPKVSYDLDCKDIGKSVRVVGADIHRLDRDGDGSGCESY